MLKKTARAWKEFYRFEREALGLDGLRHLLDEAPHLTLPVGGALIFPHTRLRATGRQVAAVARAVLESGCREVIALGVLHGGRECDAEAVAAARAGNAPALAELRRIHGPELEDDTDRWLEEFSLDGFRFLIEHLAERTRRPLPIIHECYPFLTGTDPRSLPGFTHLERLRARGAALVATTDPIHHGIGYGLTPLDARAADAPATLAWAQQRVTLAMRALAQKDYPEFLRLCAEDNSDFRDVGPVLAELVRHPWRAQAQPVQTVDYTDVLGTAAPTWVAATVMAVGPG